MFDSYKIVYVSFITIVILFSSKYFLKNELEKLLLILFSVFFFFYSGLGSSFIKVDSYFLILYTISLIAFNFTFVFFCRVFSRFSKKLNQPFESIYKKIDKYAPIFLLLYFILLLIPLIYPTFRLGLLLSPPLPDLRSNLSSRLDEISPDTILKIVSFIKLLITPFYYIILYKFKTNKIKLFFLIILPLYIQYVDVAYLGRGKFVSMFLLILIYYWITNPSKRSILLISLVSIIPFVLYFMYIYTYLRLGSSVNVSIFDGMMLVIESEVGFIKNAGEILLNKEIYVDISKYIAWVITLFVPINFIYTLDTVSLNFEMSSHILGYSSGRNWYVNLPGPLAESVYIYGSYFFWLHFLFLGILTAFLTKLFTNNKYLLFLYIYTLLIITYNFNRAGIASILPLLSNQFWLLYILLIYYKLFKR
jgi:hypothetical protein